MATTRSKANKQKTPQPAPNVKRLPISSESLKIDRCKQLQSIVYVQKLQEKYKHKVSSNLFEGGGGSVYTPLYVQHKLEPLKESNPNTQIIDTSTVPSPTKIAKTNTENHLKCSRENLENQGTVSRISDEKTDNIKRRVKARTRRCLVNKQLAVSPEKPERVDTTPDPVEPTTPDPVEPITSNTTTTKPVKLSSDTSDTTQPINRSLTYYSDDTPSPTEQNSVFDFDEELVNRTSPTVTEEDKKPSYMKLLDYKTPMVKEKRKARRKNTTKDKV